jgi:hypothetical protein
MRRLLLSAALALVALPLLTGTASASHLALPFNWFQPTSQDKVWGFGTFPLATPFGTCQEFLYLNARSNNFGNFPTGFFYKKLTCPNSPIFPPGTTETLAGPVTCLAANGSPPGPGAIHLNHAVVGGPITFSTPFTFNGGTLIEVDDNNSPGSAGPPPDKATEFLLSSPPSSCPKPIFTTLPVTSGNFVVHDALPFDP